MKILILTLGTRGDFELFLTLARELHGRGHEIVVGTSAFYADRLRAAGLDWIPVGKGKKSELLALLQALATVADGKTRTYLYYRHWLQPQLANVSQDLAAIAPHVDYFISNIKVALQRDEQIIPHASITYDPPAKLADLTKYNACQRYGDRAIELVALNRDLLDRDRVWDADYQFTGFWMRSLPLNWQPPQSLAAFLAAGTMPIAVTMGSMAMFEANALLSILAEALKITKQRAVIVGGWWEIEPRSLPPSTHFAPEIPYEWLFPRASCVVHHGGVGTIASVLRAGKPSILLPQILCQEHFGHLLMREQLATGVFDLRQLNPQELAAALHRAIADPAVAESVRSWQHLVEQDPGVSAAASAIERHSLHLKSKV